MAETPALPVSSDAIRIQMQIMNALVTGAPLADALQLVLEAVQLRFPNQEIGIWTMKQRSDSSDPTVTLVAHRGWPVGCSPLDGAAPNSCRAVPEEPLAPSTSRWQPRLPGFRWFAIPNTQGRRVGWLGWHHPEPLSATETLMIDQYIHVAGLVIEKAQLDEENHFLAYHDYLTEIPNRRLFHQRLDVSIARALESHRPLSIGLLDVNRFKTINDTYGHRAGDRVLREVARRIADTIPEEDTVARMGGDEFGLIFPHSDGHGALQRVRALMSRLSQPLEVQGTPALRVQASAGIATFPIHATTADTLLHCADTALYEAKNVPEYGVILFGG